MTDTNNTDGAALLPVTPGLLPCPKCGGRAFIAPHPTGFPVWCIIDRCLRLPPRETKAEAITAWNTRISHPLPATQEDAERSGVGEDGEPVALLLQNPETGDVEVEMFRDGAACLTEADRAAGWTETPLYALSTPQRQEYDGEAGK